MQAPASLWHRVLRFSELCAQGRVAGRRVFIRADLHGCDVDGLVEDVLPCIRMALKAGAAVLVTGHRGRSKEGVWEPGDSLAPVAQCMGVLLGREVPVLADWLAGVDVRPGQVVVLENCRANVGERRNDVELSKQLARLCDIFVNDAPSLINWQHSSNLGVALYAEVACAGPRLVEALDAVGSLLAPSARPLVAVAGGSSINVQQEVLHGLSKYVDTLVVGGALANSFLVAAGCPVGRSLAEPDMAAELRTLVGYMQSRGAQFLLPNDVVTAKAFAADAVAVTKGVDALASDDLILDIGPRSAERFARSVRTAGSVIWWGCMGVYEFPSFAYGTKSLAQEVERARAFRLVAGPDTVDAFNRFANAGRAEVSLRNTAALRALLGGRCLPVVDALIERIP